MWKFSLEISNLWKFTVLYAEGNFFFISTSVINNIPEPLLKDTALSGDLRWALQLPEGQSAFCPQLQEAAAEDLAIFLYEERIFLNPWKGTSA